LAKGRGCHKHKEKGGGEELTFLEVRKRYEFEKSNTLALFKITPMGPQSGMLEKL